MASVVKNPNFKAPKMPPYTPYDVGALESQGVKYDTGYYSRSDADFSKRHPELLQAEGDFENQTLKDQTGNTELLPQLQNEYMRSGLAGALGSFGAGSTSAGGVLAPGSAGEADVARGLGLDIQGFQQQNRQNRLTSLTTAENLFPRRSFGLSGADTANISMANTLGQNNWNQADYATRFQTDQLNWLNQAQNTQAQATANNVASQAAAAQRGAIWSGIFNSLGSLVGGAAGAASGGAGMCWVAREIFGTEESNGIPMWKLFRSWMLKFASMRYLKAYAQNGPTFAQFLRSNPQAKAALEPLFREKIVSFVSNEVNKMTYGL